MQRWNLTSSLAGAVSLCNAHCRRIECGKVQICWQGIVSLLLLPPAALPLKIKIKAKVKSNRAFLQPQNMASRCRCPSHFSSGVRSYLWLQERCSLKTTTAAAASKYLLLCLCWDCESRVLPVVMALWVCAASLAATPMTWWSRPTSQIAGET